MNKCKECKHFRKVKPASQLFVQAIGTTDAAISNALVKIQEDENQQKGNEANIRMNMDRNDKDFWGFQPVMSDFCGLREEEEIYLIKEIKNLGGQCTDFELGHPEKQSCSTCVHRIIPEGVKEDLEMELSLSGLSALSIASGISTNTPDNQLSRYQEGVTSRKAFEMSGVYSAKGILATKPDYFDYCAKFSCDDEYVICLLRNPYNTCSAWKSVAESKLHTTRE